MRNRFNLIHTIFLIFIILAGCSHYLPESAIVPTYEMVEDMEAGFSGPKLTKTLPPHKDRRLTSTCSSTGTSTNQIIQENCRAGGVARAIWDPFENDDNNTGFTDKTSYKTGDFVKFKFRSNRTGLQKARIDIYRYGYYNGNGARLIDGTLANIDDADLNNTDCSFDSTTHKVDCSNWNAPTHAPLVNGWKIPAGSPTGIYFALFQLKESATSSTIISRSVIPFVVKSDLGKSVDVLFQVSDMNWQVYNQYGGYSMYGKVNADGSLDTPQAATEVSFNRPYSSHGPGSGPWRKNFFESHMPLLYFLEKNGISVGYISEIDTNNLTDQTEVDRIKKAKVFISVGHDEYWTSDMRKNITDALRIANSKEVKRSDGTIQNTGTSLLFLSANTMFERVRYNPDTRVITSKKEIFRSYLQEPDTETQRTTVPRDHRFEKKQGITDGRFDYDLVPENELMGLAYTTYNPASNRALQVSNDFKALRQWRNISNSDFNWSNPNFYIGKNQAVIGYELDERLDNGFEPAGVFPISSAHVSGSATSPDTVSLTVEQSNFASASDQAQKGYMNHQMILYKHASGGWVFSGGSIFLAMSLEPFHLLNMHDPSTARPEPVMQQLLINVLADMGVNFTNNTFSSGLAVSSYSTDTSSPAPSILLPATNTVLPYDKSHIISGKVTDNLMVASVEISTDNGTTWHPAQLKMPYSYDMTWSYEWVPDRIGNITIKVRATDDSGNISAIISRNIKIQESRSIIANQKPNTSFDSNSWVSSANNYGGIELGVRFSTDLPGNITGMRFYKQATGPQSYVVNLRDPWGNTLLTKNISTSAKGWITVSFDSTYLITKNYYYAVSYHTTSGYVYQSDATYRGQAIYKAPLRSVRDVFQVCPFKTGAGMENQVTQTCNPTRSSYPNGYYSAPSYLVDPIFQLPSPTPQQPNQQIQLSFINQEDPIEPEYKNDSVSAVGNNFKVDSDGLILGIRYYKDSRDSGLHLASLYRDIAATETGDYKVNYSYRPSPSASPLPVTAYSYLPFHRLADTRFINESDNGWQTTYFTQPIPVQKDMNYVAAVHTTTGYVIDHQPGHFEYYSILSQPLRFLGSVDYTRSNAYPSDRNYEMPGIAFPYLNPSQPLSASYRSHRYLVDVIYVPTASRNKTMWNESTYPTVGMDNVSGQEYQYYLNGKSPSTDIPVQGLTTDLELGVGFVTEVPAYVLGVKAYKPSTGTNKGPIKAHLWWDQDKYTSFGEAAFTSQDATGWVTALFPNPIRIPRNERFVASFSTSTDYAVTYDYFSHAYGSANAPLRFTGLIYDIQRLVDGLAPQDLSSRTPERGYNGLAGASNLFPRYQATGNHMNNYWVQPIVTTNPGFSNKSASAGCTSLIAGTSCENGSGRCSMTGECLKNGDWCKVTTAMPNDCVQGQIEITNNIPYCKNGFAPYGAACVMPNDNTKFGSCDGAGNCVLRSPIP